MYFVRFEEKDELLLSKYKIPEPKIISNKVIAPEKLDLVIVPSLGFNHQNFRLGRGGGYYDHAFEFKKHNQQIKPYLLGIGYEFQRLEFTIKSWDIPMDKIITNATT